MRHFVDEALARSFREIVPHRGQAILFGRHIGRRRPAVGDRAGEAIVTGHVGESDEGVHAGELPRMIEFQPRDTLAVGQMRRLREASQWPTVHEGFEDVLLDREYRSVTAAIASRRWGRCSMAMDTPESLTLFDVASVRR